MKAVIGDPIPFWVLYVLISLVLIFTVWSVRSLRKMNSDQVEEERVRIFSKYYQFILGSVGVALITLFINTGLEHRQWMIDDRESRISELPVLQNISNVIIADSIELDKKIQIIQMMKTILSSQNSKEAINTISQSLIDEEKIKNSIRQTSISKLNKEVAARSKALDEARNSNQPEIEELEKEFQVILDSIDVLKAELNKGIVAEKSIETKLRSEPEEEGKINIDNCRILNSLINQLDFADGNYQLYRRSGFEFQYAELLYDGNRVMLEKIDSIFLGDETNESLKKSLTVLKNHFLEWNQLLDAAKNKQDFRDSTFYRADYDGTFPDEAAQNVRIQYEWLCNGLAPDAQMKLESWENTFVLKQSRTNEYFIKYFEEKQLIVGLKATTTGSNENATVYVRYKDSNIFQQDFNLDVGKSETFRLKSQSTNGLDISKELQGRLYEISLLDTYKSGTRKYAKIKLRFLPNI